MHGPRYIFDKLAKINFRITTYLKTAIISVRIQSFMQSIYC